MFEERRDEFEFIYRAVVKETESEAITGRIFGNFNKNDKTILLMRGSLIVYIDLIYFIT